MSVLQRKRSVSKMEYVSNAYDIEKQSIDFVKRLTPRNARIYQDHVIRLAMLQSDLAYIANELFPTNKAEYQMRRLLHGASMAVLHALDKRMSNVYDALMDNPQEAFNRKNGSPINKSDAIAILDRMAEQLGGAIDKQDVLLKGIRDSDRDKSKSLPEADPEMANALVKVVTSSLESVIGSFL